MGTLAGIIKNDDTGLVSGTACFCLVNLLEAQPGAVSALVKQNIAHVLIPKLTRDGVDLESHLSLLQKFSLMQVSTSVPFEKQKIPSEFRSLIFVFSHML